MVRLMQSLSSSSVALLGVPVDNITMDETLREIEACIAEGGFHQFATANSDFLIQAYHDRELTDILAGCQRVLPDGMPLLWAARLMGTPLRERVTGADLVPRVIELAARRGYRIFLLGASEASSHGAAEWIGRNYPEAKLAGRYSPRWAELEDMDHEDLLSRIEAARPDILLVALGCPKQEKWIAMHSHRLRVPVCIGVGCALDLLAGRIPRAPRWMQDSGLEWLFRACTEPARLGVRYIRDGYGLAVYMTLQLVASAAQQRRSSPDKITEEIKGAATVVRVAGRLTGTPVSDLEQEARVALGEGHHLVLDLFDTTQLGPDALGTLIHLANIAGRHSLEFWLTGLRPSALRLLRANHMEGSFRTAPRVSDALRRIAPAQVKMSIETGHNWAVCRIGGRLIPLDPDEASGVCQQVLRMIEHVPVREFDAAPAGAAAHGAPV